MAEDQLEGLKEGSRGGWVQQGFPSRNTSIGEG
jgi:hypothetical protein